MVRQGLLENFLGHSPLWYKWLIATFLMVNPLLLGITSLIGLDGGYIVGWAVLLEFIVTLALALRCYPLQPGGLIIIEALLLGLVEPDAIYHEIQTNLSVLLLLIFMVAGVYFLRDILLLCFSKILVLVRNQTLLSLFFLLTSALTSAFFDALTVTALLIAISYSFYRIYHVVVSGTDIEKLIADDSDESTGTQHTDIHDDMPLSYTRRRELNRFRGFLRGLLMHSLVGTALGGVCTLVGEPQNLLIAERLGWSFIEFFRQMLPVSAAALVTGVLACLLIERLKWFGYGIRLPRQVLATLADYSAQMTLRRSPRARAALITQTTVSVLLVVALATHVAEIGLIGLGVIILATAFGGLTQEHQLGEAFHAALPFTALLTVFFAMVAIIHAQHLFEPVTNLVFNTNARWQPVMMFVANGVLSSISDNVFVASVYMNEIDQIYQQNTINRKQYEMLAIAINTGTNLPSIATPNGQAAFLFMLTSHLAPIIRLSYGRMVLMALPYTILVTAGALAALIVVSQ